MSGSRQHQVSWKPEWTEALRAHLMKGLSATMAAIEVNTDFGTRFSRNAVISKASREGIPLRAGNGGRPGPKGGPSRRKTRMKASTEAQRPDIAQRKAAAGPKVVPAVPFVPRTADVVSQNVPLLELAPDGCRWPSDAPPFVFCNCPQVTGLPYCGPHSKLAYRAPEPRTRPSSYRA